MNCQLSKQCNIVVKIGNERYVLRVGKKKKKKRLSIVQILKNWNLENHLVS